MPVASGAGPDPGGPCWLAKSVAELPPGEGWLTPAEAARAAAQRFAKRRDEYLLRRLAAKHAVAAVRGLPADRSWLARIEIGNDPAGAPYVLVDGEPAGLPISLTDRAGWAVCLVGAGAPARMIHPGQQPAAGTSHAVPAGAAAHAVTGAPVRLSGVVPAGAAAPAVTGAPVQLSGAVPAGVAAHQAPALGCDLELIEPRSAAFVRDYFTPAERAYVSGQPAGARRDLAANLVWSAKESALKVLRTGLRLDTREVDVTVGEPAPEAGGWARLRVTDRHGAGLPGWWRTAGVFVLTVVAAAPTAAPAQLETPEPLATAEPFPARYRRTPGP